MKLHSVGLEVSWYEATLLGGIERGVLMWGYTLLDGIERGVLIGKVSCYTLFGGIGVLIGKVSWYEVTL